SRVFDRTRRTPGAKGSLRSGSSNRAVGSRSPSARRCGGGRSKGSRRSTIERRGGGGGTALGSSLVGGGSRRWCSSGNGTGCRPGGNALRTGPSGCSGRSAEPSSGEPSSGAGSCTGAASGGNGGGAGPTSVAVETKAPTSVTISAEVVALTWAGVYHGADRDAAETTRLRQARRDPVPDGSPAGGCARLREVRR